MYALLNVKRGGLEGKRTKDAMKRWFNALIKHNAPTLSVGRAFEFAFARAVQFCVTRWRRFAPVDVMTQTSPRTCVTRAHLERC